MNWNELKTFCNSLNEEQLQHKVILWRETEAISNIETLTIEEDQYVEPDVIGDGCFPKSEAEYIIKNQPEEYPNMDSFKKVYNKDTPILHEIF